MAINVDLNNFIKKLNADLKKTVDRNKIRPLATFTLNLIRERTRRGFGVTTRSNLLGSQFRLPPFSNAYIDQRIRNSRRLSRFASITKPNNTFTGKMLSDFKVSNVKSGGFTLGFKSKDSRKKAEYLADMGRNFVGLTKKEFNLMVDFYVKNILNRNIKD